MPILSAAAVRVPEVSNCAIKSPHKASFELMFGRVAKSEIGEDVAGAFGNFAVGRHDRLLRYVFLQCT
jgi:hypothetical protein